MAGSVISSGPNPFSIGGLTLVSIDCPTELRIGSGEQSMAVQRPVGGSKVVHTTGFHPDANTWKGVFHEPNVFASVETLRRFMVDGKERLVTWRTEQYYGVVSKFTPVYRKGGHVCDWQLDVEITRDTNGAFSTQAPRSQP
jgi:hypothetical protein